MLTFKHIILLLFFIILKSCTSNVDKPEFNNIFDPSIKFDNNPPLAHLRVSPDSGISNETEFTFDASASKESEQPNANLLYRWDFDNDGEWDTAEDKNPVISHIFKNGGGLKKINVHVRGAKNLYSDTSVFVFVNSRPRISLNVEKDVDNNSLFHFDATASRDEEDGVTLEYRWDFYNDDSWEIPWSKISTAEYEFSDAIWSLNLEVRDTKTLVSKNVISNVLTSYPLAYYPFNGNSNDASGNQNNAIIKEASLTFGRKGNANSAYSLDGTNDFIRIRHNESLNLGKTGQSYSVSIWVKSEETRGNRRVIQKWDEKSTTAYPMAIMAGFERCLGISYDGVSNDKRPKIEFGNVWDNNWHHLVYIVNASDKTVSGYLDGQLVNTVNNRITTSTTNNVDIYIGVRPVYNLFFKGTFDDLRIYERALTDIEVGLLYNE